MKIFFITDKRSVSIDDNTNTSVLVPQIDNNNNISDKTIMSLNNYFKDLNQSQQLNNTRTYNGNGDQIPSNETQSAQNAPQSGPLQSVQYSPNIQVSVI